MVNFLIRIGKYTNMIVNDLESHFEIIFQRAHGLLAAKIASHLKASFWPGDKLKLETLVAIADHDDGRKGWAGDFHINEKGHPKSYQEFTFDYDQAVRISHTAACKSTWVALLISKHLEELYKNVDEIKAKNFIAEQRSRQKLFLGQISMDAKEAGNYYSILKWSDELSLRICQNKLPCKDQKEYLAILPHVEDTFLTNNKGEYMHLPWVFDRHPLTIEVEYRNIPHRIYKNDDDLRSTLNQAQVKSKSVCFHKPEKQP